MAKSKKIKSNNHNTEDLQVAKIVGDWEDYFSSNTFQMQPANGAFKDRLALELIEWGKRPTSYKISQFYTEKGILEETYYRWVASHENLGIAHKVVLTMLGNRREIGAIQKKLEPSIVKFTMPLYDQDWVKREKDVTKLNEKGERGPISFDVYMDSYKLKTIEAKKDDEGVE